MATEWTEEEEGSIREMDQREVDRKLENLSVETASGLTGLWVQDTIYMPLSFCLSPVKQSSS